MRIRFNFLPVLLFGLAPSLLADVLYSVTDLGPLVGYGAATAINNAGQVVGNSYTTHHAFLYDNGRVTDLGAGSAFGINDLGQVTGTNGHAFIYSDGQIMDLGALPGHATSGGFGINNAGDVVGSSDLFSSNSHVFLYSNGRMMDLGISGVGNAINNAGEVVGGSFTTQQAFLYSNGQLMYLGSGTANAINNAGEVVGGSFTTQQAFLYSNGQLMYLGTLPGYSGSDAAGINDAGQVVGSSAASLGSTVHAFLYSNGQMQDLNDLIDPALGITLEFASGINNSGEIIVYDRDFQTYLLTPVPEPGTLAMFGAGFTGLLVFAMHGRSIRQ